MAFKNKSMYAILGVLNLKPSTGYDIKRYCDTVLSGFWNENYGHIYPTLKMMNREGMIAVVGQEENERKICYQITERGRSELSSWLTEETISAPVRSEFLLKFIFSSNRTPEEIEVMLTNYKEYHMLKRKNYVVMLEDIDRGIQEIVKERELFVRAILRKGVKSCDATIEWCDETLEEFIKTHSE